MTSKRFQFPDRMQMMLMPHCIDDWIPEDHFARFIVEILEQIDMSKIYNQYTSRGARAYDPRMLLSLMVYGYTQGIVSSRKIEAATHSDIAFRFLSGNLHPDHDTIATFRKRFLQEIKGYFTDVILIANEMGLVKMGNLYLDGTKMNANASKSKAMSYKHMKKTIAKLEAEIQFLLDKADAADEEDPEMDIPEELKRREQRLAKVKEAKKEVERRAQERFDAEQAEYEEKKAVHDEKTKKKQRRGSKPSPPKSNEPKDGDQFSFTDPESRIMKTNQGYQQGYNGQAAVTEDMLIVAHNLNNHANDFGELLPTLDKIPDELDSPENVIADNGYLTRAAVDGCDEREINAYISLGRESRRSIMDECEDETKITRPRFADVEGRLETKEGKELYRKRKFKVEPVFGIIKEAMKFRRFMMRGEAQAQGEWGLVCLAFNLKRMFSMIRGKNGPKSANDALQSAASRRTHVLSYLLTAIVGLRREFLGLPRDFLGFATAA